MSVRRSICVIFDLLKANYLSRTVFHIDKALIQVILREEAIAFPWSNECHLITESSDFASWFVNTEGPAITKKINANISSLPPWRVSTYRSAHDSFLVFSIHHALYDGISLSLLMKEIESVYLGANLSPATSPEEILDQVAAIDLDHAQAFWRDHFEGFKWPNRHLAREGLSLADKITVPFLRSLSSMKALAASQSVTLQALFTCTFASLLGSHIYESRDVTFGVCCFAQFDEYS